MGWNKVGSNKAKNLARPNKYMQKGAAQKAAIDAVNEGVQNPLPNVKRRNLRNVDLLDSENDAERVARLHKNWDKQADGIYGSEATSFDDNFKPGPIASDLDQMVKESRPKSALEGTPIMDNVLPLKKEALSKDDMEVDFENYIDKKQG
jgi:uncharacterized protein (DUF2384 family)